MRRKITAELSKWKNSNSKNSLLLYGARQVGKTYSLIDFANNNYSNVVYINFSEDDGRYAKIFDGELDAASLTLKISVFFPDVSFVPGDTAIILDEIQECPRARTSLKFFAMDGRYDVLASGSLLGIRLNEVPQIPVGYVHRLWMYPMDFEEWLWALGFSDGLIETVRRNIRDKHPFGEEILSRMMEYLNWYMMTGGMPEAVSIFMKDKNYTDVRKKQDEIMNDYMDDMKKHCEPSIRTKALRCFEAIPNYLAKDSRRFVYSDVDSSVQYKVGYDYYALALDWLVQAGIALECRRVSSPTMPAEETVVEGLLPEGSGSAVKLYLHDTGLLLSRYDNPVSEELILGNMQVNRGSITEDLIAVMLHSQGRKLLYFEKIRDIELDFILVIKGRPTAVEVKSGRNRSHHSLKKAMDRYGMDGLMFDTGDIRVDDDGVTHYPLFAAAFMDCIDPPADIKVRLSAPEELEALFSEHRLRERRI